MRNRGHRQPAPSAAARVVVGVSAASRRELARNPVAAGSSEVCAARRHFGSRSRKRSRVMTAGSFQCKLSPAGIDLKRRQRFPLRRRTSRPEPPYVAQGDLITGRVTVDSHTITFEDHAREIRNRRLVHIHTHETVPLGQSQRIFGKLDPNLHSGDTAVVRPGDRAERRWPNSIPTGTRTGASEFSSANNTSSSATPPSPTAEQPGTTRSAAATIPETAFRGWITPRSLLHPEARQ